VEVDAALAPRLPAIDYRKCPAMEGMEGVGNTKSFLPHRSLAVQSTAHANAFCERQIGTIRRECLDWLIPMHERHLRWILREWVIHYNQSRPHASLGPGVPNSLSERNPFASISHQSPKTLR
jgi:transposase InsO family protein